MKQEQADESRPDSRPLRARQTMLGARLCKEREYRGWSQGQLAKVAGLDRSIVSRLESGETRLSRDHNLEALARALEVPVEALEDLAYRPIPAPSTEFFKDLEEVRRGKSGESKPGTESVNKIMVPRSSGILQVPVSSFAHDALGFYVFVMWNDPDWQRRRIAAVSFFNLITLEPKLTEAVGMDPLALFRETLARETQSEMCETLAGLLQQLEARQQTLKVAGPCEPTPSDADEEQEPSMEESL